MDRLGFGYQELSNDHPALIYCSLSGLRPHRPLSASARLRPGRPGDERHHELHRRGPGRVRRSNAARRSPTSPPGILAAMGILAAYAHRLKTGEGQWVETSLFEAALVQTYWQSAIALATGVAPRAMGSAHPLNAPYQAFQASDGWIVVGGANQQAIGVRAARSARRARACATIRASSTTRRPHGQPRRRWKRSSAETLPHPDLRTHWLDRLDQKGVPCGPVYDMLQALGRSADRCARDGGRGRALDARAGQNHRPAGEIFRRRPARCARGAPLYGEHTRAVLAEYGFGDDEIAALEQEGAVVAPNSRRRSSEGRLIGRTKHQEGGSDGQVSGNFQACS